MIEASGMASLEPWELAFCKWAAAHQRARAKEQEAVASDLAGTTISWVQLRHLRARKSFQNWYHRYRAKILQRLDEHREAFESENVGEAIKAHKWALEQAQEKEDYRAIPALAEPAIKALYKHIDEQADKPLIVLNLGNVTSDRLLNAPPIEVSYEELPAGQEDHDESSI